MIEYIQLWADYILRPFDIGPESRFYFLNWVVFLGCGLGVYILNARRGYKPARSPLAFLFPKKDYLHASTLVDIKVYIANYFVGFGLFGISILSTSVIGAMTWSVLSPLVPASLTLELNSIWMAVFFLPVLMANDLASFINHKLGHEMKLLWPFHKLHHSAEVLTPITLYRKHPVFGLLSTLFRPLCLGPVLGVMFCLFGEVKIVELLGMNAGYALFVFAGANLRHSDIWITYPRWLSHIFVSPAMHQIHHSVDPKHYDKNYGEIFALWDWMFGSLYIPTEKEDLIYGVLDDDYIMRTQPHPTLKAAYLVPLFEFTTALREVFLSRPNQPPVATFTIRDADPQPDETQSPSNAVGEPLLPIERAA